VYGSEYASGNGSANRNGSGTGGFEGFGGAGGFEVPGAAGGFEGFGGFGGFEGFAYDDRADRPGSAGEHRIQHRLGTTDRADRFYDEQVLDHLNARMREFVQRQEMFFLATADRNGECDSSFRAGPPGFLRVLDGRTLIYPEYRGNGVQASLGNILENPHLGILLVDFTGARIGLHINGSARIVEDEEIRARYPELPEDTVPGRRARVWVWVEVEEAYIHCAKHIPQMQKVPKGAVRDWGTDDYKRKGGDFFGAARDSRNARAEPQPQQSQQPTQPQEPAQPQQPPQPQQSEQPGWLPGEPAAPGPLPVRQRQPAQAAQPGPRPEPGWRPEPHPRPEPRPSPEPQERRQQLAPNGYFMQMAARSAAAGGSRPGSEDTAADSTAYAPANGVPAQGVPAQGVTANGVPANGVPAQGVTTQGVTTQGVTANGGQANGAAVNGGSAAGPPASAEAIDWRRQAEEALAEAIRRGAGHADAYGRNSEPASYRGWFG